ncbi:MAG: lysophospholipid acyltransferase family protein [Sumerlaeia bacterium]
MFPKTGPLIIACNHTSMIDPPILAVVCGKRELKFMAKKELFENSIFSFLIRNLGAYPIDRESLGDKKAIVETIRLLKAGNAVVIFPEGTRSQDGRLKEFQPGVMRLALSVPGCVIAPVYISGGFEAFGGGKIIPRPCKISVRVGELLDPSAISEQNDKKKMQEIISFSLEKQLKALEQEAIKS